MKHFLIVLALMLLSTAALADSIDTRQFDSVSQEQQYRHLTESLRCPKCQNNSIADSNSTIAADMRLKVYELLRQGQTPEQIKAWMIDRYGNFVSYQPPVQPSTLILWAGPLLFIVMGALVIVLRGRQRSGAAGTGTASQRVRGSQCYDVGQMEPNAERQATEFARAPSLPSASGLADGGLMSPPPCDPASRNPVLTEPPTAQPLSRWALLPGGVLLAVISVGFYLKIGGLPQVLAWQQVKSELPALRRQVMDPQAAPLNVEQLVQLALGIRSELQREPHNLNDWMMLGRLGMVLNNPAIATQSFERALKLVPDNAEVRLSYAEVLTRSGDTQDNRRAGAMLSEMLQHDGTNLRLLGLLAFNAFNQQDYPAAIEAWDKMLALLPAKDPRVEVIRRSIAQARSASGQQNSRLALQVNLSPEAEKMLPEGGVLYISVSDGTTPVPVAVKKLPLSHFPLSLTLDDSNAMMPERLLSALHQVRVRVEISRDGSANPQPGDWFGLSEVTPFNGQQQLAVTIDQQVADDNP
ncbi:cytochrome c-type biogenesis protein CcmH [Erwinia sp. JUb26]|uniref:cytochrome c-type biogenesis protein CcmH n=1 Tax=Erwinia sp. JUb26 TaxID=2485126 RepID=UPI000FB8A85C|nr:cytochrome c-type biogenesis protein CcmH [Erwinia sp. JUb26]ROR07912.1 cytochrome c-type biogenesis protein CcmH/NrfF [Erwinia sp. JUb26]